MGYRVRFYKDDNYEVIDIETEDSLCQGSLSDCEAWIWLHKERYM